VTFGFRSISLLKSFYYGFFSSGPNSSCKVVIDIACRMPGSGSTIKAR
jgi:hypothetical protein